MKLDRLQSNSQWQPKISGGQSVLAETVTDCFEKTSAKGLDFQNDWKSDGCLQGANGQLFPADTLLSDVPPVLAKIRAQNQDTVVFVNGIMTDAELQNSVHEALAQQGYNVVGVRNATAGMAKDLAQCAVDKINPDSIPNKATRTTLSLLRQAAENHEELYLIGHSQGALIINNAVQQFKESLKEQGKSKEEVAETLSHFHVNTIGGAVYHYASGPKYSHFVNWMDPVAWSAGLAAVSWLTCKDGEVNHFTELKKPHGLPDIGDGVTTYFSRAVDGAVHGAKEIYIPNLAEGL